MVVERDEVEGRADPRDRRDRRAASGRAGWPSPTSSRGASSGRDRHRSSAIARARRAPVASSSLARALEPRSQDRHELGLRAAVHEDDEAEAELLLVGAIQLGELGRLRRPALLRCRPRRELRRADRRVRVEHLFLLVVGTARGDLACMAERVVEPASRSTKRVRPSNSSASSSTVSCRGRSRTRKRRRAAGCGGGPRRARPRARRGGRRAKAEGRRYDTCPAAPAASSLMRPSASVSPEPTSSSSAPELDAHALRRLPCSVSSTWVEIVIATVWRLPCGARGRSPLVGATSARRGRPSRRRRERVDAVRPGRTRPATRSSAPPSSRPSVRQTAMSARLPGSSEPMSSRARTAAPPRVASRSASRAAIAAAPPRPRATSSACFTSKNRSPRSFEAEPSTPRPDAHARIEELADGRDAGAEAQVRGGTVRDADARARRTARLVGREMDAMRTPGVLGEPAHAFAVFDGRAAVGSLQYAASSTVSAKWVCSCRPSLRASEADSSISRVVTENGEQGATTICTRSPSWSEAICSVSARNVVYSSASASGGRPPSDSPRSIEPREAAIRRPTRGARTSASTRPVDSARKT